MKFNNKEEFLEWKNKKVAEQKRLEEERFATVDGELLRFVEDTDVPELPKPLTDFHVTRLIACGAIPKADLVVGKWYYGAYRNAAIGRWNGTNFDHWRWKFGWQWQEGQARHFQDDDGFALFVPIREATRAEIGALPG